MHVTEKTAWRSLAIFGGTAVKRIKAAVGCSYVPARLDFCAQSDPGVDCIHPETGNVMVQHNSMCICPTIFTCLWMKELLPEQQQGLIKGLMRASFGSSPSKQILRTGYMGCAPHRFCEAF
eukprot:1155594-Pelagomonas_calceolata.AAC.4